MSTEGKNVTRNIAVTLTAEPIFGRALTLAECSAALAEMSLGSVVGRIVLFKHINEEVFCNPDVTREDRDSHTTRLLHTLLPPGGVARALEDIKNEPIVRPLSDQALLATLELALRCCPRDTRHWISDDPLRSELTHVLLSFQSALFSREFRARADREASFESLGAEGQAEFIRNTLAHNSSIYSRHAIGRLYALCCVPAVADLVLARTGRSARDWFLETFQLTPEDYVCSAFMSGAPARRLDTRNPDPDALSYNEETFWNNVREPERTKVKALLNLATQPVGERSGPPAGVLDDFLYSAERFHVRPVLDLGPVSICVSPDLMLRKFLFGLPYLAQEARCRTLGRPLKEDELKGCRSAFGILFEGYVVWLLRQLLNSCGNVEVLAGVRYGPKAERRECDAIVIRGEVALVLEVKTTMTSLSFRRTGRFEDLDAMLENGAKQAYHAAHAIREGKAFRSDDSPIEGVRWIVPCVVTYDDIPLFEPISEFYEVHLTRKTGLPLFVAAGGVEPVQFFDVGFLESWETEFDLSPRSGAAFGYLIQRARRGDLRYRKVSSGVVAGPVAGAPQPFNSIVEASRAFIATTTRSWIEPVRANPRKSAKGFRT